MSTDEAVREQKPESVGTPKKKRERERSTVQFVYNDLSDAEDITKAVHGIGGSSCEIDQLAAKLKQAAAGGGFRQRMLTAKTFGLIRYSQGKVTLTPLGNRLCDPLQERRARVDAFLTVPLFKLVYEKFKGLALPPNTGLENEMVALGVSPKQKDKARQVFQRSAKLAGFFWSGEDRLVMPTNLDSAPATAQREERVDNGERRTNGGGNGSGGDGGQYHPFIQGLLKELPKPTETEWPIAKRARWLRAAAVAFDMIYTDEQQTGAIEVTVRGGES